MNLIIPAQNLNNIEKSLTRIQELLNEYAGIYSKAVIVSKFDILQKFKSEMFVNLVYPKITSGAMCTALLAIDYMNINEPIIISGSNSLLKNELPSSIDYFIKKSADVGIITFESHDKHWSFVRVNNEGFVTEIAEKRRISNLATTGIFYFKNASLFLAGATWSILNNLNFNDQYYISHSIPYLILQNKIVTNFTLNNKDNFKYEDKFDEKV